MDTADHESLYALAAQQQSLFTTAQASTCGVSRKVLRAWARSGRVVPIHVGVWALNGVAPSPERAACAALLAHGSQHSPALCRRSAAWVWEIPGHPLEPIRLIRARGEHHPSAGTAHTSRTLDERDLTVRRGLRLTTPTRTIFDLAGSQHPARTRRDLNDLTSRGLVSLELLDDTLVRLARKGRPGITIMRQLIEELRELGVPAGSSLELRVEELFPLAGLRGMHRQVEIGDDSSIIARVDFADLELGLVVEVDSDRFHHGLIDRQLDAAKTARLEALGLTVIRIAEREVWHDRSALVARLRHAAWECRSRRAA
jgi:very-short-patch-repair endonuclease